MMSSLCDLKWWTDSDCSFLQKYPCLCLSALSCARLSWLSLCWLNEGIADSVQISIQRRMFFGLLNLGIFKRRFYVPIIVFSSLLRLGMSVFSGFVTIWVKLPSSAPTLWYGVLSLVNWAARLHCLLPSAPMHCQNVFRSSLGWTLSWPTVVQESYSLPAALPSASNVLSEYFPSLGWTLSWPTVVQESCGFFGLHRSTSWCLVFSFLPRSCFCCQIYQLFFWFIFTLKFILKTV